LSAVGSLAGAFVGGCVWGEGGILGGWGRMDRLDGYTSLLLSVYSSTPFIQSICAGCLFDLILAIHDSLPM